MDAMRIASVVAVMAVLCSSGCVLEQTRNMIKVDYTLFVSYDQVVAVNFTAAKQTLLSKGYTVKPYPEEWDPPGSAYDSGAEIFKSKDFVFDVAAFNFSGTGTGLASGSYNASMGEYKTEKELDAAKKYLRTETDRLAGLLNLTIDWKTAKWSVSLTPPQ
jgi:hypothetical protein